MLLTPKNWGEFQHYKDRAPVWIKLHRSLLDNYDFCCLPVASKALAPFLWLLASEYEGGAINASLDAIAFRLRMTRGDLADALAPLIESGFFSASEPLADGNPIAIPEKETELEKETEKDSEPIGSGAVAPIDPTVAERDFFRRGKEVLGKSAGGQLAKLRGACGNNIALARSKLELAATKENPSEFVAAVIRGPPIASYRVNETEFRRRQRESREVLEALDDYSTRGGENSEALAGSVPRNSGYGSEGVRDGRSAVVELLPPIRSGSRD